MVNGKKVLLVEDDETLRETLSEQLELHEEFVVIAAENGAAALEMVKAAHFDMILLDVSLPDMDGRDVCRRIRRNGVTSPIVMLAAQNGDADRISGLDAGADDYVTKPFKISALLARMRAPLRHHEQSDDALFTIGPYCFWPSAKFLLDEARNKKVRLTEKETTILKFLYQTGGRMVKRDALLNEVWGYNAGVTTHTLETHVYRLRQKIEIDPSNAQILVTEPGGYRLVP